MSVACQHRNRNWRSCATARTPGRAPVPPSMRRTLVSAARAGSLRRLLRVGFPGLGHGVVYQRPKVWVFGWRDAVAGCLMVLDLIRSLSTEDLPPSNYVQLDPWRPPTPVRRLKPRRDRCEFCGDAELKAVFASLWELPAAP
jgi:hypothetical protein